MLGFDINLIPELFVVDGQLSVIVGECEDEECFSSVCVLPDRVYITYSNVHAIVVGLWLNVWGSIRCTVSVLGRNNSIFET